MKGKKGNIQKMFMVDKVTGGQQKRITKIQELLEKSLQKYIDFCNQTNKILRD